MGKRLTDHVGLLEFSGDWLKSGVNMTMMRGEDFIFEVDSQGICIGLMSRESMLVSSVLVDDKRRLVVEM